MPEPSKGKRRRGSQRERRSDGYSRATGRLSTPASPVARTGVTSSIPGGGRIILAGAIVLVVLAAGFLFLRPGGGRGSGAGPSAAAGTCPTSQPPSLPAGQTRTVTLNTPKGAIVIKVVADLSPIAAGQFVALASCGFYDGSPFHRVVPNFVIQGGGSGTGVDLGYTIQDEKVTAKYGRGVVAMARTSQPNSVDSQFFIVLSDAAIDALAAYDTYQIIGNVTSGMETADAIASAADAENPSNPVIMTSVSVANP